MTRKKAGLILFSVLWLSTLLWAAPALAQVCPKPITGDPDAPRIKNVRVAMRPDNALIFNFTIALERPARVWVEYQRADGMDRLQTASTQEGVLHELPVMRLRADMDYCYQVFARTGGSGGPLSAAVAGVFRTGPLPPGLADASFRREFGAPSYDLTLLDINNDEFTGYVIIDRNAAIVWYYDTPDSIAGPIFQKPDYHLLYIERDLGLREITPAGDPVNRFDDCPWRTPDPPYGFHHDLVPGPDNTVLFLAREVHDAGPPYGLQVSDTIAAWYQETGDSRVLLDLYDFIPVTDRTSSSDTSSGWRGCPEQEGPRNWTHTNSLSRGPRGNAVISIRHLNQVVSIAPDFKSLEWRLGGPGSDFTFPDPRDQFYHQHSAKLLPNGHLLLFDNGNTRPAAEGGLYSRALELALDVERRQARKVWEYRFRPDLFAECCGNVTRLDNGNTVMVFGRDLVNHIFTLVEADPRGETVSVVRIASRGQTNQYRAYPLASINGESQP